jgi:hypothetical protein
VPSYPDSIYRKAAEAAERELFSPESVSDSMTVARAVLDAVAEDLGQHAAAKILRHADEHEPKPGSPAYLAWHQRFGTAARVAAFAFLTDDDKIAIAARELAAGNFVACPAPEGER